MLDTYKGLIAHQFEAALCTLKLCIDACPETGWHAPVVELKFCQVAFHTLFFTDLYLGRNEASLRPQPFHRDNQEFFRDYEELEDRPQVLLYEKPPTKLYLQHCRSKAAEVIAAETAESLTVRCGFPGRLFSRAELYVCSIRHIQHHAAQLSLRLKLDTDQQLPWVGSGWRDEPPG